MAADEFLVKLQNARKAVEEYKKERLSGAAPSSESLNVQDIQKELARLMVETKNMGAPCTVCPYCGGSGKV